MSGINVSFRGMCLSSVVGAKVAYTKFITEPELGLPPTEFQVSSEDKVDPGDFWKIADWELKGFEPISGSKDGRQFAFFRCKKIKGEFPKGSKKE
jgi:hypothetical protein